MTTTQLTVSCAVLTHPTTFGADVTVAELVRFFADEHVHAAPVVDGTGLLLGVVERGDLDDLRPGGNGVVPRRLTGRTVDSGADLDSTWNAMRTSGQRRRAVVDADGHLVGLLCLKRSGRGFCSDEDVSARSRD